MIQRIQSLFLLGVVICMIALLFSPVWAEQGKDNPSEQLLLNTYSLSKVSGNNEEVQQNTIYLSIIAFIVGAIAGYEIFSYKNRIRQRMLGGVNSLIMILLIGIAFYLTYTSDQFYQPDQAGKYQIGFFLIMAAIVLNILANRFIMRDEKLVRSADRMRD
jgi:hypothetical protein